MHANRRECFALESFRRWVMTKDVPPNGGRCFVAACGVVYSNAAGSK